MDYDGEKAEIYGPVANLDTTAMTFEVAGFSVDYSGANVEGSLQEGAYVEVEGTPDANDPALIHAYKVEVKYEDGGDGSCDGELKGAVESVDYDAMLITVGGQTFWADAMTIVKQDDPDAPLTFGDLQVGDWVEVKFDSTNTNADGYAYAAKIEVKGMDDGEGSDGSYYELEGYAQNVDTEQMTFELNGFTVVVDDATVYEVYDSYADAATFWGLISDGDKVEVKGAVNADGDFLASKIELDD